MPSRFWVPNTRASAPSGVPNRRSRHPLPPLNRQFHSLTECISPVPYLRTEAHARRRQLPRLLIVSLVVALALGNQRPTPARATLIDHLSMGGGAAISEHPFSSVPNVFVWSSLVEHIDTESIAPVETFRVIDARERNLILRPTADPYYLGIADSIVDFVRNADVDGSIRSLYLEISANVHQIIDITFEDKPNSFAVDWPPSNNLTPLQTPRQAMWPFSLLVELEPILPSKKGLAYVAIIVILFSVFAGVFKKVVEVNRREAQRPLLRRRRQHRSYRQKSTS